MSGHSHWAGIKHQKSIEDVKRGKIFSKMTRLICIAAKDGTDPSVNPKLRQALEEARSFNMPKENVERAIKKGAGGKDAENLEEVICEALGPAGTAIIIESITDNKNRTLGELKQILQKHNCKLADAGSVKWLFERKGIITINPASQTPPQENLRFPTGQANPKSKEELELIAIEAGAEDIYWHKEETEDLLDVYTKPENLEQVKKNLQAQALKFEAASLGWMAKEEIELGEQDKEKIRSLFEELDENEAVQDIYSNLRT